MLGKTEGKRKKGQERMRWLDSITDLMDMNLSKFWETMKPGMLQCMGLHRVGHNLAIEEQQQNFKLTNYFFKC